MRSFVLRHTRVAQGPEGNRDGKVGFLTSEYLLGGLEEVAARNAVARVDEVLGSMVPPHIWSSVVCKCCADAVLERLDVTLLEDQLMHVGR